MPPSLCMRVSIGVVQPDRFVLTLRHAGHQATFKLQAFSVDNAFNPNLLVGFSCPEGL